MMVWTVDAALWQTLSEFVDMVCEGRDESHGHAHMEMVANNTIRILESDYLYGKDQQFYNDALIVAWLHDVNDHKYDFDGQLKQKLKNFIDTRLADIKRSSTDLILNIIERISFSRENKQIIQGKPQDWDEVIGQYGKEIRHIVSDADKIEALGYIGLERCIECAKNFYKKKFNKEITHDILVKNVSDHANEKLLLIKDHFIRTKHGKHMAEKAHDEFVDCLISFVGEKL